VRLAATGIFHATEILIATEIIPATEISTAITTALTTITWREGALRTTHPEPSTAQEASIIQELSTVQAAASAEDPLPHTATAEVSAEEALSPIAEAASAEALLPLCAAALAVDHSAEAEVASVEEEALAEATATEVVVKTLTSAFIIRCTSLIEHDA